MTMNPIEIGRAMARNGGMRGRLFRVDATGRDKRPRITIQSGWLAEEGFAIGSLVQALPESDGMVFHLYDEYVTSYSELSRFTEDNNGKLFQIIHRLDDGAKRSPVLVTSGRYIRSAGLSVGDVVVARRAYGIIRVRKVVLAPNELLVPATYIKDAYTGVSKPKVRLSGKWLLGFGFTTGSTASVSAESGVINIKLENADKYAELVCRARREKLKIVQFREEKHNRDKPTPCVGMVGSIVERAGVGLDDIFVVACEYGLLRIRRLDVDGLNF